MTSMLQMELRPSSATSTVTALATAATYGTATYTLVKSRYKDNYR